MSTKRKPSPDFIVREIKRKTRRKYSAEEKICNLLEGLRGEESIADLCRRETKSQRNTEKNYHMSQILLQKR